MSKPIQLLPGLSIHFAGDDTWLYFDGPRHKGGIALGVLANRGHVCGPAIADWINEKRRQGGWFDSEAQP